ncbi:hypothetical protein FRB99_005681 [Tulasnella sp. 403]|nr:hypothetical protein FRB99_005681 [Tulasnella sp. 403]
MDTLQDDDEVRPRLYTRPSSSQQVFRRQVLKELEPLATKLHMSSQALLTIIFIVITVCTIGFAVSVHIFHKRYHHRQIQHATRIKEQDREKNEPTQRMGSVALTLKPPEESHSVRVGRGSWVPSGKPGVSRGDDCSSVSCGRSLSDGQLLRSSSASGSVHQLQVLGDLRNASRPSSSSLPSAPRTRMSRAQSDDVSIRGWDSGERSVSRLRSHSPIPSVRISNEDHRSASLERPRSDPSAYGEAEDFFEDYYSEENRDSLASYYHSSYAGRDSMASLIPPITTDGARSKCQSAWSIGGLVDMYADSPTMGMGSPSSPNGMQSRLFGRTSQAHLPSANRGSKSFWKQPAISATASARRSASASAAQYPFATPYTATFSSRSPMATSARSPSPAPPPSTAGLQASRLITSVPPQTPPPQPPYIPPPIPSQFRALSPSTSPPPSPERAPSIPIAIPSVPPRLPTSGVQQPIRRRLRGLSLHGEIMRMAPTQ